MASLCDRTYCFPVTARPKVFYSLQETLVVFSEYGFNTHHLFLLQPGGRWAVCSFDSRGYGNHPRKNQPGPATDLRSDRGHRICAKPVDHTNLVPGEAMNVTLDTVTQAGVFNMNDTLKNLHVNQFSVMLNENN